MRIGITLAVLFSSTILFAQCPQFGRLMRDIDTLLEQEEYAAALNKLEAARAYCPDRGEEVNKKTWDVFFAIEAEKEEAEKQRIRADSALLVARKVLFQLYFYQDKFGLTLIKESNTFPPAYSYGFIDRKGNTVIPFEFEEATPFFVEDGFARVLRDGQTYLLDTLGNMFIRANALNTLSQQTEALDLHEVRVDSLPANIGDFAHLNILLAYGNYKDNGKLFDFPPSFMQLKRLSTLRLAFNGFTRLPENIHQLENLYTLDVSYNQLGQLPDSIGYLEQLRYLDLRGNQLKNLPDEIEYLSNLEMLDLGGNVGVEIPEALCALSQLKHLNLNSTGLTSLPARVGALVQLRELYLNDNQLGTLPEGIGYLSELRRLEVNGNRGISVPVEIGDLSQLRHLGLGVNGLREIPKEMGKLSQLRTLNVYDNELVSLPPEIGQLSKLERLNLRYNQLDQLPIEIGSLYNLTVLDVSHNQLTHLPESIEDLSQLDSLSISFNQLGSLPSSIGDLFRLTYLDASNNALANIPTEMGKLYQLHDLDLSGNRLEDIPEILGALTQCQGLNLQDNQIDSLTKKDAERLSRIQHISLLNNPLTYIHPHWYTRMSDEELVGIGRAAFDSSHFELAYTIFDTLTVRSGDEYGYWFTKSFYACFVGKYEEAIKAAQESLTLAPKKFEAHTNLALGYLLNDQFEEAKAVYIEWKDKPFYPNGRLAKEIFLRDLAELEAVGIQHPDIDKIKHILSE